MSEEEELISGGKSILEDLKLINLLEDLQDIKKKTKLAYHSNFYNYSTRYSKKVNITK
jgi:hypothetical protein